MVDVSMNPQPQPEFSIETGLATSHMQYGALCYRFKGETLRVLMVTTRRTGRWILPKGWPMKGRDGAGAAAREAWEEAGVIGTVHASSVGLFFYSKILGKRGPVPCMVQVYPIHVSELADRYPERGERRRKWFSVAKAAKIAGEPDLARLLGSVDLDHLRQMQF
ncbi:NUDIX hydrolase [Ruegeria marisflavi]|nr:NUDIX hydrolase [Ruegeria sp. WL0004]